MDIPTDVLGDLKCHSCEGYLSRSTVYLQHDGAGLCGQCYAPERPATRNKQYEAVAKLLKFPCKNKKLGCRETVPFAAEAEEIAHDTACFYRWYVCPVLGSAYCKWTGPRAGMLAHCHQRHPDRVFHNPCSLKHDITTASMHKYIIFAFDLLFLLHTKVCVDTWKIFHSVRLLGGTNDAADYCYTLDVKRGIKRVTEAGQVAPERCLEDPSLALYINCLLAVLDGFDGITFNVTLKRKVSAVARQQMEKCRTCRAVLIYPGGRCMHCASRKLFCWNRIRGCTYSDYSDFKCSKHTWYFCEQRTGCGICSADVPPGTLAAHYGSAHQDVTYRAGSTWREKRVSYFTRIPREQHYLLTSAAGTAVCECVISDSQFVLSVFTPVPGEQLHKFRCSVQVTDPATRHTRSFTPDFLYDSCYDWYIELNKDDFPSSYDVFDVSVDISKIE